MVSLPIQNVSRRLHFERLPQLHLKTRHGQVADSAALEFARSRIKHRCSRGILGHGFHSRPRISRNSKRPLRPAENAVRLALAAPEKYVGLLARAKFRHSFHSRMQAVDRSSKRSNRDQPREQALVLFDDFEPRVRPDLAIFPSRFRTEATKPRHRRRLLRELLESQPRERGRARRDSKQCQPRQKQNPKKSPPLHITHFTVPPARRSRRSCPNLCSG